jgi:hypothetical protein
MPAWKALVILTIGAAVLAAGAFAFVPATRPPIVQKWIRNASGFAPAKTPQEAIDRFRDCIKKRDYKTAAEVYCAGDYREQMLKGADEAKALGDMIDSLLAAMTKHGVNNDTTRLTLRLLEPFPKSFKVTDIKTEGDRAVATILGDEDPLQPDKPLPEGFVRNHGLLISSLVPLDSNGLLSQILLVKDASGYWKLSLPVTERLRLSVDALKKNGTNYRNAIQVVRDEVKNNPVTKEDVQAQLIAQLDKSK